MSRHGLHAWCLAGLLLALCGPPTHSFEVKVEGTSSEVGYGGTVLLNCSSSCPDEEAPRGMETSLSKEWVAQGPGWLSIRLHNITEPLSDVFCFFSCFGERKVVAFRVLAYEFPQPQVAISPPITSYNKTVAIECSSEPSWPPGLKLRLHGSHWPPQHWVEGPVRKELRAREEDDGAEFSCEGQLSLGNRTLQKSSAVATLRVTYQPRMDDGSCPPSQNWTEGQDETLRCWARGNPPPHMECAKNGEPFPVGVPHPVTRTHAGTYHCKATNPLGTAVRTVTVWVQYQPRMDDGSCPPSQNWTEGQDETLRCWAWGNPPPHMECAKNGDPFPVGVLHPITRTHAGTYHCKATNPLGTAVRTVTVWVQYQPRMDDGSCPPSQNWTEGQDETLRCWARGNPPPHMECAKNGEPFPVGVPHPITRTHAGTYHCKATNPLGTAVRTVTVWVQYHDPNLLPLWVVGLVLGALLVPSAVGYRIYYRKKKIREYRLREKQRRLQMKPPGPEQEDAPHKEEGAPP